MYKIFIDPGHGGNDNGGKSIGLPEKTLNMEVAKHLDTLLTNRGFEVYLSRNTDTNIGLLDRSHLSNTYFADITISIHHNANNGTTKGHEVIYSMKSERGKKLANLISEEFKNIGQNPDGLGVYSKPSKNNPNQDYYSIIRHSNSTTVITEFAYMDNEEDYKKIIPIIEAEAIYKAILKFYGLTEKKEHWSESTYQKCVDFGMKITDKRFDDTVTRGEMFAMFAKLIDKIK